MNFGDIVKKEILSKNIKDNHCKKAFLAGLIRGSGALFERDGEICLSFKMYDEDCSLIVSNYLRTLFGYEVREARVYEDKLHKKEKFEVVISGDDGMDILSQLNILTEKNGELVVNFNFYDSLTEKECCLKSFLRGLFVSSGVCLVPDYNDGEKKTKYHLELVFSHVEPATATNGKLIEQGIFGKVINRKDNYVLYIKSAESIKDFFAYLNANVSVLKLTDLIINRELINDTNRRMNCDMGNVNKQVDASQKQIEAIALIENTIGLDGLKSGIKEVCVARKNYPEDTLLELAERLQLSKSCLNHRLRKIIEIAKEIKGKNNA